MKQTKYIKSINWTSTLLIFKNQSTLVNEVNLLNARSPLYQPKTKTLSKNHLFELQRF